MIDIYGLNKHVIATDGTSVLAYSFVGKNHQFTSGQSYLLAADTEEEVFNKVFQNPSKAVDPETSRARWVKSQLTFKGISDIQNAAEK